MRNGLVLLSNTMNPTLTSTGLERETRIPSAIDTTLSIRSVHQPEIHDVRKMYGWRCTFEAQFFNEHKQVQEQQAMKTTVSKCNN
mmetsp:Transcript_6694/g.14496  ORF Transcript_6694/g.14496 Transcript_6694/m.14496 type:complete len:85 (+) Transcript_6694:412-666(+)